MSKANALLSLMAVGLAGQAVPVIAQEQAIDGVVQETAVQPAAVPEESGSVDEIVVTARRRQESILKVPAVATVISEENLQQLKIDDVTDLPSIVPGLIVGHAVLSTGALLSIRGVGTTALDPGVDQSVSFNIDGMPLYQGLAFMSGTFDLQQIEVLKGPQTLFYGKSSPGGVISLRTADPTNETELVARTGYEFEARTSNTELIASGPVSDTVKLRLAGMYRQSDGYFYNSADPAPSTGALKPSSSRNPDSENWMLRLTSLWDPTDRFSARFKLNYVRDRSNNPENAQLTSCPDGTGPVMDSSGNPGLPFILGDDCRLNRTLRLPNIDPAAFPGIPNGGVPFGQTKQAYGSLELNYELTPALDVGYTGGYYELDASNLFNASIASGAGTTHIAANDFSRYDFTQELRLDSDFTTPLNFTTGAFYQKAEFEEEVIVSGNTFYSLPAVLAHFRETVPIEALSVFGQLRWQVIPELELAGGLRWSDETRKETVVADVPSGTTMPATRPELHSTNTSPEFTITYTPTDDLTLFGAYKQGYKSGSYNVAVPAATPEGWDNAFDEEKVKGGEVGLKSRLFNRQVAFNVAAYDYRFEGLQVGVVPAVEGVVTTKTVNAGAARTYGLDLDAAYSPAAIDGLSINTALNWNHGRYTTLDNIPCWGGQTFSQGCDRNFGPAPGAPDGAYRAQSLSDTQMVRAPEWQANLGFSYDLPMGEYTWTFVNSNMYSSEYVTTLLTGRPNNDHIQDGFIKTDLGISLRAPGDRYEISLLAKNVGDQITAGTCTNVNAQNGVLFGGQITGGTNVGPAGIDEMACFSDPGREIWLRGTYRWGSSG